MERGGQEMLLFDCSFHHCFVLVLTNKIITNENLWIHSSSSLASTSLSLSSSLRLLLFCGDYKEDYYKIYHWKGDYSFIYELWSVFDHLDLLIITSVTINILYVNWLE